MSIQQRCRLMANAWMRASAGQCHGRAERNRPSDNRIYLISGHLDSRVSDVMNRTADAPGANDDGSGWPPCWNVPAS
jgi:hypothetical protein